MRPHSGALLHALRDRGYRVHHHPPIASFQPGGLPEARLPDHITHPGGGGWLAYKKHTSWTPLASPLNLPHNCPSETMCAVELTLLHGDKIAIISCYLPQAVEAHSTTCDALSELKNTLPHSLIILGGTCMEVIGNTRPRRTTTSLSSYKKGGRGQCFPPSLRANNRFKSHVLIISLYRTPSASHTKQKT